MLTKKDLFIILTSIFFILTLSGSFFLLKSEKISPIPQAYHHEVKISSNTISAGDSLYAILNEEGFPSDEIFSFQNALKEVYDPKKFQPGDKYEIIRSTSGVFNCFRYYPNLLRFYVVEKKSDGGFSASAKENKLEKNIVGMRLEIKTSLWDAIIEAGGNPELTMRLADIFSWQIDFFTELRSGDVFKFVWERYSNGHESVLDGHILAAQYQGAGGLEHTAVFFEDEKGDQGYYTKQGKSLRSQFLKAPLNYRRISSYFSKSRFHPVLRYYRPHLGIDYAAQEGTPVVTIGDGVITFRGEKGQNGNLVIIKHNSVYTTTYGHLSRFAKGQKKGSRVKQGQVIGYVGSTGLATGPHLDFRIKKYDQPVNFLKLKFTPSGEIKKEYKEKFDEIKKERLSLITSLCDKDVAVSQLSKK